MRRQLLASTFVGALTIANKVFACPFCESDIGQEVSAGIFNSGFASNAALTLLPLAILLAIVAAIHFGLPEPRAAEIKSQGEAEPVHDESAEPSPLSRETR